MSCLQALRRNLLPLIIRRFLWNIVDTAS
jgi:hypothetical protein